MWLEGLVLFSVLGFVALVRSFLTGRWPFRIERFTKYGEYVGHPLSYVRMLTDSDGRVTCNVWKRKTLQVVIDPVRLVLDRAGRPFPTANGITFWHPDETSAARPVLALHPKDGFCLVIYDGEQIECFRLRDRAAEILGINIEWERRILKGIVGTMHGQANY